VTSHWLSSSTAPSWFSRPNSSPSPTHSITRSSFLIYSPWWIGQRPGPLSTAVVPLTPSRIIALLRTHFILARHDAARLALANLYTSPYPVLEQSLRCLQVGDWVKVVSTSRLKLPSIPEGFLATSPLCGWHPPAAPALLALTPWPCPWWLFCRRVFFTGNPVIIPALPYGRPDEFSGLRPISASLSLS
jgi:hypothetical protein